MKNLCYSSGKAIEKQILFSLTRKMSKLQEKKASESNKRRMKLPKLIQLERTKKYLEN